MTKQFITILQAYDKLGVTGGGSNKQYIKKELIVDLNKADTSKLTSYKDNQYVIDDDVVLSDYNGEVIVFEGNGAYFDKTTAIPMIHSFNPSKDWMIHVEFAVQQINTPVLVLDLTSDGSYMFSIAVVYGGAVQMAIGPRGTLTRFNISSSNISALKSYWFDMAYKSATKTIQWGFNINSLTGQQVIDSPVNIELNQANVGTSENMIMFNFIYVQQGL